MLKILENISLKPYNTFGINVKAARFAVLREADDLLQLIREGCFQEETLLLGGGSNLLFTGDYAGLVVRIENKGIAVTGENEDFVRVRVAAGENWHEFVEWCLSRDLGGVENLSLIPGNVGSCPIQNIGAYGSEVKDVVESVETYDLSSGDQRILKNADCRFGYRDSIFKQELKGKVLIWAVHFRLAKNPVVQLEYGAIQRELQSRGISKPVIKDVSEVICSIRRSKLPDPAETGNAGSFFKNPAVSAENAELLMAAYPGIVCFRQPDLKVKLAAGWLIEQCNWKGFRRGDAGVHPQQALVLVNYGNATGQEIVDLSEEIRQSVLEKFDVLLETEVNVI